MLELRSHLKFFLILSSILRLSEAGNRHVDLVRCSEQAACSAHIDEALVEVISDHLHNETDPCENFWDYACGEWSAAPFYDHVDNFGAVNNYYVQKLQELLEEDREVIKFKETPQHLFQQLRLYYSTCRNTKTYFLELSKYFAELPHISTVQWPEIGIILSGATGQSSKNFDWTAAVADLRRFGLNGVFLDESVGMAFDDSTKYVIELKMPDEVGSFQNKHEILKYFEEFDWLADGKVEKSHLQLAAQIFELDLQLRDLRSKHILLLDESQTSMTLKRLQREVPNINWWQYFSVLLNQQTQPTNLADLPIEVANTAYLRELAALFQATDNQIVSSYILMRFAKYLSFISPRITAKDCMNHLGVAFPLGINFLYDRFLYSKQRSKDERILQQIFLELKIQFLKYLQANKLNFNKFEQRYLQQKLYKMQLRVGNLPRAMPLAWYDHYYDNAKLSQNNFFHNHLEMLSFRTRQQHLPLLSPSTAHINPAAYYVNDDINQVRNAPYYVHQRNMLIVPMTFMHLPFFHHATHAVFQYSLMGWIMAHEMNHAFETEGILFDADGNESELGIEISKKSAFVAGISCLAEPPTDALVERVADVNGFQLAYDAFLSQGFAARNELTDYNLFTADFTPQQLYFLNFAQFFCGDLPQAVDHDRDDVRVIEILHHMPEFVDAFDCSKGRRQKLVDKCEMWRSTS